MRIAGYHEKMIGRTYVGGDQVTKLNLGLYNTIKLPYQPKHSPSNSLLCHKRIRVQKSTHWLFTDTNVLKERKLTLEVNEPPLPHNSNTVRVQ